MTIIIYHLPLYNAYFLVSMLYKISYDIQRIRKITPNLCELNRISSPVSSYFFCIQQSLLLCASERCQNVTKTRKDNMIPLR